MDLTGVTPNVTQNENAMQADSNIPRPLSDQQCNASSHNILI